jgi:hypothetical protein
MQYIFRIFTVVILTALSFQTKAQDLLNNPGSNHGNKFEKLGTMLPTPNEYRTASGAPGPKYWQQRCDYDITAELDENERRLWGKETITYTNNSPDILSYLWLQLDENQHSLKNNSGYDGSNPMTGFLNERDFQKTTEDKYGINITKVVNEAGAKLDYTINKTMMRVELPQPLKPGQRFVFKIDWNYFIPNRMVQRGRGGYEYFPEDGNDIYTMAQWYPRLCVYSDFQGWQNSQFVGAGEFALTFGNFKVAMTVPADHVVMATGEGQNYKEVLTADQYARWQKAQTAKDVVEVVTLDEAVQKEKTKLKTKKTWRFNATMVRDFAWGSSRKFVWDAMPAMVAGKKVMCMSGYGKEAYGLYRRYSTKVVAHTIKTYSDHTIPYPYPVAQSIEASNGMEYPMICFNYGRTEKDGTYSEGTKNGMISVIIHEVGHNFFPMIINSDERQWTWMDEGLNTFCQYIAEQLWDNKYPSGRGPAYKIADYMNLPKNELEPIMTNSENIINFGPNAYAKPATGLNILRETIMGRELFDYAFKEYARRWAFKHPTPADLFRTMGDASAENLDWFWRGWFYTTDVTDQSLDSVKWFVVDRENRMRRQTSRPQRLDRPMPAEEDITRIRNRQDKSLKFATEADTSLQDFYWKYSRNLVQVDSSSMPTPNSVQPDTLTAIEKNAIAGGKNVYELTISNKGGLVMPVIIEWTYTDGSKETDRISQFVWRKNENQIQKTFIKDKEVRAILLDPMRETADVNTANNSWNMNSAPSKFQLFKAGNTNRRNAGAAINPMQKEIRKN